MRERHYNNKVLEKAMQVIDALGYPEYVEMSIDELSAALKVPKGTLMPYLAVFERHQWLEQSPERKWRIAPGLTRLIVGFQKKYNRMVDELKMMKREHLGE
ncbi:MAG TPA: helix-turn-helix domain-containing protein [Candidatus Wunengus sp. YC60]|uniref:helix-turn-helix domain-containing protein n=1 Tax=Candidatus Wunengus sp. YC60 TaxID=3367697 RepID=UPI0040282CA9